MSEKPTSVPPFVRPPSSPVFGPTGPALVLPRRGSANWMTRPPAADSGEAAVEARQHLADLLTILKGPGPVDPVAGPGPGVPDLESIRGLEQWEQTVAERERVVEERERRLAERERDLAEAEVLLQHHQALIRAAKKAAPVRGELSAEERAAQSALKAELDRQESVVREGREALREREKFIEASETRLFEKVQEQQEKETELEQREEELREREAASGAAGTGGAPEPAVKRPFDEFNE